MSDTKRTLAYIYEVDATKTTEYFADYLRGLIHQPIPADKAIKMRELGIAKVQLYQPVYDEMGLNEVDRILIGELEGK